MSFTIGQLFNSLLGKENVLGRNLKQEIDKNKDNVLQAEEIKSFRRQLDNFRSSKRTDSQGNSAIVTLMSFFQDQPQRFSSDGQNITEKDILAMIENSKNVLNKEANSFNLLTSDIQGVKYDSRNELFNTVSRYCKESNRTSERVSEKNEILQI